LDPREDCSDICSPSHCTAHDPICITLETFALHNCPRFRALSYEWGDEDIANALLVNNRPVNIRLNLLRFLKSFRLIQRAEVKAKQPLWAGKVEYLWIDQISIDQNSTEERNHQVLLMSRIFPQAYEVIAWLGFSDLKVCSALKRISISDSLEDMVEEANAIVELTFWTRLWIQQELILAAEVVFMAGTSFCPALQLLHARLGVLQREPALAAILTHSLEPFRWISLWQAISLYSGKRCADPRDKVYGLLGMVHPDQRIEVRYDETALEVWQRTMKMLRSANFDPNRRLASESVFGDLARTLGSEMSLPREIAAAEYKAL
jgi:hypothetical protein